MFFRYITILPSIHLSIIIDPETAIAVRHPSESNYYVLPSDIPHPASINNTSEDHTDPKVKEVTYHIPYYMDPEQLKQFYPRSRKELLITVCLGVLSIIVISYFMVVLYKCVCSRNYSKWRASWSKRGRRRRGYVKHIKETVPLVLKGHNQVSHSPFTLYLFVFLSLLLFHYIFFLSHYLYSSPYLTLIMSFSFQPVLNDWCNKGRGMCYPVCGMVHIKEPLLLIRKSSPCGGSGFPLSLSEWSLTICLTPYNRK